MENSGQTPELLTRGAKRMNMQDTMEDVDQQQQFKLKPSGFGLSMGHTASMAPGAADRTQASALNLHRVNKKIDRDNFDNENETREAKRGEHTNEDQYFKKQMEFKGGKRHQLITDQYQNSNKIYANRYQGIIGVWYFIIDCSYHFENFLAILLFVMISYSKRTNSIDLSFPVTTLLVNITLMVIRNITFELRQRKITNKINNKMVEYLLITMKFKRFIPISWADIKPGYIIKVRSGQEFPADCLLLDIMCQQGGSSAQKCYVTSGPFDDSTGIIQKKSFLGTSNKTGTKQNAIHFAEMISGLLKFEYNYFGYCQGSFKLFENPSSLEFDNENVVQRGGLLTHSPEVVCLVLNVGDQCMGSVYKDPKSSLDSLTNQKLKSFVKTQRSFDKAYKQSIRVVLIGWSVFYLCLSAMSVFIASNENISYIYKFEMLHVDVDAQETVQYLEKGMGFFSILLSSIPLSFSNIIDLLVLMSTNFAEWDVNVAPAKINFIYPHATLAFGKVAHMFFSRMALQRDDKQCVRLFHIGNHFFKNECSNINLNNKEFQQMSNNSKSDEYDSDTEINDSNFEQLSLDYLPNELQYTTQFKNSEVEMILTGDDCPNKRMLIQFFRGITLCHQTSVTRNPGNNKCTYTGIHNDEIHTLEFSQQFDFTLVSRKKKIMTLILRGSQERYEELGIVTTKAVMGHFMTICAVRVQGQQEGILYMKGSIATLKQYFIDQESDFEYLNQFEQKFISSGVQSIVYAKRQLTIEETNQLIITINEGIQQTRQNKKLDNLLYNLSSVQLEILGIVGLQKAIHMRNRVAVDEMILNGVKPWIISKEDEQSHLTALNSLRMFQGCHKPLIINGKSEHVVMEQIQNALKIITERMEQKSQKEKVDEASHEKDASKSENSGQNASKKSNQRSNQNDTKKGKSTQNRDNDFRKKEKEEEREENLKNVVFFTGKALVEIMRDQTMIKSFITLAYISNMMIGSYITPIQKQNLLKMVKSFIGEGEYAAAIVTTPEDQFMVNEADLCANLKTKGKSSDFEAVVDVSLKDFSAISYLLFKHGNHIQMRLSKASQAFFYRGLMTFLIVVTYMTRSGFSGSIPFTSSYYFGFTIFLSPIQILVYAIFFKDNGYDYFYRIFGHYKYNFSFTLVETEYVILDYVGAFCDWLLIYMPFEIFDYQRHISVIGGRNISTEAYNCYQVILMQFIFLQYFRNTNVYIIYMHSLQLLFMFIGITLIFTDERLVGVTQMFTCPSLCLILVFQALLLEVRNQLCQVMSKLVFKRYSELTEWYIDIEERLAFEEYEDINQAFSINQNKQLYKKINSANIQRTLQLINTNMMKCPKTDGLNQILENINIGLDNDRRGQVTQGSINKWNLKLNDLNKETEYQDNKYQREIIYVKRQLIVFIFTTLIFSIFGGFLVVTINYTNIGIYYYLGLSFFSFLMYQMLPRLYIYLSKSLLFYTCIVIFCYTIYTSGSESLQPAGLIFVLALVAGLNHSYIFPTILMIMISVLLFNFFSFLIVDEGILNSSEVQFMRSLVWVFTGIIWSVYVYMQEYEKKTQFINGHRLVRSFIKLKNILDILVPSVVRDKLRQGQKNFAEYESEVTIIFFDIFQFDDIVSKYTSKELLSFMDQVYNTIDQLCDQYGLLKIEAVGKTYMACGGLKLSERKVDTRLLNRHHSVRCTDFGIECQAYLKQIILKSGKSLEVRIGIHTGPVISGILGETKPQFSVIGESVKRTIKICQISEPGKVCVSKETLHYLELYTNNLSFQLRNIVLKGIGKQQVYQVSLSKGKVRTKLAELKDYDDNQDHSDSDEEKENEEKQYDEKNNNPQNKVFDQEDYMIKDLNDSSEYIVEEISISSTASKYSDHKIKNHKHLLEDQNQQFENDSNKSDLIDDETMNLFGFNDDLNLDDRIIVKNATDNNIYNVVERPKYLLQFEQKDLEQEFLFIISKQEATRTPMFLILLMVLNKTIVFGDQILDGKFSLTPQFILMFPVLMIEIVLCYKLSNPRLEQIYFWTGCFHVYSLLVLGVLLSLQVKYLGKWTQAGFNELQIQLTITLIFFMRNILLRHFIITYTIYMVCWIVTVTFLSTKFEYQIFQFIIGQIMYAILLCIGIHHREMIQRKSINYERILNVEINKTNELISKLLPHHMLNVIKSEKRQVDEFDDDMTLLYTDIIGANSFNKVNKDSREIVVFIQKVFARFDQLCEENRVYKVHTVGNKYVIMGYNGRVEKFQRNMAVVVDEANRVIQTGFEMLDIIKEVREQSTIPSAKDLTLRIGIHTGKVYAGIIGSKQVRYDIFGEGVLTSNKIEQNGVEGECCISEDTQNLINKNTDFSRSYNFEFFKKIDLHQFGTSKNIYKVTKNLDVINKSSEDHSQEMSNSQIDEKDIDNDVDAFPQINSERSNFEEPGDSKHLLKLKGS